MFIGIELADSMNSKEKPLSKMRVALTAIDLEQAEHRGIAYLSKGLISSLSDLGAEVYLLTGFYGRRLNPLMKFCMSAQSVKEVDCADILDQFCDPRNRLKKTGHSGSGWIFILTTHNCLSCCWKDCSLTASFSVVSQKSCGVFFPCSIMFLIEESE